MEKLLNGKSKDSRIKANKIRDYIKALATYGVTVGQPYVKHLDGDIWELRPLRDRILFAAFRGNAFVLLHCFMKKTQKTPQKEIEIAKKRFSEVLKEESL